MLHESSSRMRRDSEMTAHESPQKEKGTDTDWLFSCSSFSWYWVVRFWMREMWFLFR